MSRSGGPRHRGDRRRARRWRGHRWLWALSTVALVLNGVRARRRLASLAVARPEGPVPPSATGQGTGGHSPATGRSDGGGLSSGPVGPATTWPVEVGGVSRCGERYVLVAATGVAATTAAVAAAVGHAERHGLAVLDLVPGDLDGERALELARLVDPATYRQDRLATGRGACQALLVDRELVERIGWTPPEGPLVEADLADLLVEAKRGAPTTCDLAVVAGLRAAPDTVERRRALVDAVAGGVSPVAVAAPLVGLGALAVGLVASPWWAAAAAVAYCAQPVLAAGRSVLGAVRPGAVLARPARNLVRAVGVARSPARPRPAADAGAGDRSRLRYEELLAGGVDRFFEVRRTTCPWCGGGRLEELVTCGDDLQSKPGTFRLDRCQGCGHVFQNPALSGAGLDFYYGDFYDGVGEDELAFVFGSSPTPYRGRARLVRRHRRGAEPSTWLDVGTGHGHFCLVAREQFPVTRFEGLDLGEAVAAAERRGWIDEAHRGLLVDLAPSLAGRFDVVSMHHYLEHTRDPGAELAAARQVLRPGGDLLIEVPDPECRAGTVLGRWWGPWFQPQHQHIVPIANLCSRLADEGFTVVATERRDAHQPVELAMATWLLLNHLGPKVGQPWQPPARWTGTLRRVAVFAAGSPVLAAALVADRLVGPVVSRLPGGSNAYRVLARVGSTGEEEPSPRRRRRRARPLDPVAAAPAPGRPETARWQGPLLAALASAAGLDPRLADEPRELEPHWGPGAFALRLAPTGQPPGWQEPLVVRVAEDAGELRREAAALGACRAAGVRVPEVHALLPLEGAVEEGAAGIPRWALVTAHPSGEVLPGLIGRELGHSDALLSGFAGAHADLHDATSSLAGDPRVPAVDAEVEIDRFDADRFPAEVGWLRRHRPDPAAPVLCHGGYQPLCVYGPGPEGWERTGGPGTGLTIAGWYGALWAERECDVAFTLVAFWSAPFFARTRADRTTMKMIRTSLSNSYRRAYLERCPLDLDRLRFWQALHALRGVARLQGAYRYPGSPFEVAERGELPAELGPQLGRHFALVTCR